MLESPEESDHGDDKKKPSGIQNIPGTEWGGLVSEEPADKQREGGTEYTGNQMKVEDNVQSTNWIQVKF